MDKKNKFRKSLLSSAILAATLKTLSVSAVASTCPPSNTSGNVHVAPGSFCEGGVTVDAGTAVNDIGLEGKVVGNVVNNDGISDFWMDFGTLDGSFINNGSAQDVNVANGSEIYADIRNNGDMRYLTVTDGPGADTVVHGSIVNTGGVVRVRVEGVGTLVGGDIVNADGATITNDLLVTDSATVSGNVYNDGSSGGVVVNNGSTVAGHLVNDGSAFGIAVFDGSTVGGDFLNNGGNVYFVAHDGATVGGSMINAGNNVFSGVLDGSTVVGDFGNEGFIDGEMLVESSTVEGNVYNDVDGYTDGIHITDGSTIGGNVVNSGETGFMVTVDSQIGGDFVNEGQAGHLGIYDSQIAGNVVNSGDADFLLAIGDGTNVSGNLVNTDTGYIQDGIALLDGVSVAGELINDGMLESSIQLVHGSSVGADLINNGDVFVDPGSWQHMPDGAASVAGIKLDAGSIVEGNVVNNGNLIVNFPPPPPPLPDGAGPLPDGLGLQHSLAGISVDRGSSAGDIVNTGLIEVTAGLEHDGPEFADGIHANGIQVKNDSTSGSIINDGDILADTFGIYVNGSGNDGVTVDGSVVNAPSGTILTQDNGIYIKNAEVAGDVVNAGLINSSNDNGIDIENGTIGGSVVNVGSLISNVDYDAIDIDDSTIAGDVVNTVDGEITGEDGIDIDDSTVVGSVVNAGIIIADDEGFDIDQTNIGGNFANTGLIEAGRVGISIQGEEEFIPPVIVDGEMISPPDSIIHYATIGGDFVNAGEIISGSTGIEMQRVDIAGNFDASEGSVNAGLLEDGQIAAGVDLSDVQVGGHMLLGEISASGTGVNFEKGSVGGNFSIEGDISSQQARGVFLRDIDIAGEFIGEGNIDAMGNGIDLANVSIGENFQNSGDILSAEDSSISLTGQVSIAGNFNNSGELIADNHGIIMESDVSNVDGERIVDGLVSIGGDLVNSGDITAGETGVWLSDVVVGGNLINQGNITAEDDGLRLRYVTVGGGVGNFGDLTVVDGDAIDIDDSEINGNVENHGLLTVEDGGDGIDIEDSIVKGSVINFGEMNITGVEGIDIEDSLIEGDVVNAVGGVINAESDGFYIEDTHIKGSVVNSGTIIAQKHDGIDIQVDNNRNGDGSEIVGRIDGSLVSTGNITAGDNGYELDGDWDASYTNETPDGVVTVPSVTKYLEIGGKLYNSGDVVAKDTGFDIELTSIGANGVLADGQASFENHGNVTAGKGSAMDILASSVAGDFINTGDLTIDEPPAFEAGDSYNFNGTVATSPEGNITFESSGVDSEGNAWFVIKNEGQSWESVGLTAEDGSLVADRGIGPGQEVFVTTGSDNTGNYTLSIMDFSPDGVVPAVDGEIGVSAADLATNFQPAYDLNNSSDYQRGISFTGKTYYEDDGETGVGELIRSSVGGNFVNTGNITVKDEGIYLEHADIGGNVGNQGDITTEHATAIHVNDVTVGGDFVNAGNLSTGAGPVYQEGDSYRETWDGTPSEGGQVVMEAAGLDENGNQWFVIRNESDNYEAYKLKAVDGGFSTINFDLPPGEVLYVNAGQLSGDLDLQHAWNDGVGVIATVGGSDGSFVLPETESHGISLTNTTVGGNFINTGDVDAVNHGISISNVGIAGAFESTGNITAGDHGILIEGERWFDDVDGVMVTDSLASIGGHFTNTGNITSGNHGITLIDATVGGAFTNMGDITTGDDNGKYAINIVGNSEIGGDIVNSGNLTGGKGIRLHGTANLEDGQLVGGDIVSVAGGLLNSGNINSTNDAIRIVGVDLGGALINTGDIHNTGSDAIDIDDAIINGNIENHGSLVTTTADAIDIHNTLVDGHIINTGTINSSGTEGIDINSGTLVTGSILNTGTIIADSDSIITHNSHIQGSIINDGTIIAVRNDAIDINQTNIDGSVINNGVIRAGDNAFEIDGSSNNRLVIGGNVENNGDVFAIRGDGVTGSGSDLFDIDDVDITGHLINTGNSIVDNDGFDISDSSIGGSLLSSGSITAGDDGYDIDDITVAGDWINSGAITAEDSGFDVEGGRKWHPEQETPDGVTPGYYTLEPVTVGGRFVNSGDIQAGDHGIEFDLVSIGTNGITEEDGSASFINNGNITAGDGYAMKLEGTTVTNDFINTGNLTAELEPDYAAGAYYYNQENTEPSVDGQVVLTPVGTDKNGLTWFSVKNEGVEPKDLRLTEEASGAESNSMYIGGGQEVFVAMESAGDGSENFVLTSMQYGPAPEPVIEVVAESGADLSSSFAAPYYLNNELARGISLTSRMFGQNSEFEEVVQSSIGGNFLNSGNISALHEGIYVNEADIGGLFQNTGDITSQKATAIDISANSIGGDFINAGDLVAVGQPYEEGSHYRSDWEGEITPEGDLVLEFKGYDENGDAWFVVRNEGEFYHGFTMEESGGDFATHWTGIDSGEEVYINAGQMQGELLLKEANDSNRVVSAITGSSDFIPEGRYSHGIGLVGVDVAGSFSNSGDIDAYDKGIYLKNVTFTGGLQNTGDVTSGSAGIDLTNVTAGGGLLNTGKIDAGWEGIFIDNSSLDGGVGNQGDITAVGSGIHISNSTLGGDVINTAEINVSAFDDGSYSTGMELVNVDGVGNFVNQGTLNVEGNQWSSGMGAADVSMDGVVANTGTINSSGLGIAIYEVEGATGLQNSGTIASKGAGMQAIDSSIYGDVVNSADGQITVEGAEDGRSIGILLDDVVGVGHFVNHGTINTAGDGWSAGMVAEGVSMNGVAGNTGTINSEGLGIALFGVDGATGFINEGTINSEGPGLLGIASSIDGDIVNSVDGVINSEYQGIFLGGVDNAHNLVNSGAINVTMGDGITAYDTDFEGDVVNTSTGVITAGRSGITLGGLSANNVVNSGSITAGTYQPQVDGEAPLPPGPSMPQTPYGNGIGLYDVELAGIINNTGSGVIDAATDGILLADGSAHGLQNLGSVTAGKYGLVVNDSDITGNVYNNGSVNAGEDAIRVIGSSLMQNDGVGGYIVSGSDGIIVAGDDGIRVNYSEIAGGIENHGSIDAGENGIDIDNAYVGSHILNTGSITAGATGVDLGGVDSDGTLTIDGSVINQGTINAGSNGIFDGIAASDVDIDGMVGNSGDINASGSGISLATVSVGGGLSNYGNITADINGIIATSTTVDGDVFNGGTIATQGLEDGRTAGIGLIDVHGIGSVVNDGNIIAGQLEGEANEALGIGIQHSSMDGKVANNGLILSNAYGIAIDTVDGITEVVNEGGIGTNARGIYIVNSDLAGDVKNAGEISSKNSAIYLENVEVNNLLNSGIIGVREGHGIKAIDSEFFGDVINSGTLAAGHHGISLDTVEVDGSVVNSGSIMAGFANPEGNGIEIDNSTLNGEVANRADGVIKANANGIVVTDTDGVTELKNAGTIEAGAHGMVASNTDVDGAVTNSGTITTAGVDGAPFTVAMGLMGEVDGIVSADSLTNTGAIEAGTAAGDANNALGMAAVNVQFDGAVTNAAGAVITSTGAGVYLSNTDGVTEVVNDGTLDTEHFGVALLETNVEGKVSNTNTIDSKYSGIYMLNTSAEHVENSGSITVAEGHGVKVIGKKLTTGLTNTAEGTIDAGHHGISLDRVLIEDGNLINSGAINAGQANAEGNGIEAFGSAINGQVRNEADATVVAAAGGVVLDNSSSGAVVNYGSITAGSVGVDVRGDSSAYSVGGLLNTGTITADNGPAVRVAGSSMGGVINTGTINGGVVAVEPEAPSALADRDINLANAVAFDFREAGSALNLLNGTDENGNTGIINGDVYGSELGNDLLTMASGELNGDVYDVENINVTGLITLNNNVFSFNDSSTLSVKDTGTLAMGVTNNVNIEGDYDQEGALTLGVNINERSYDDAWIEATGDAELEEGSTFSVSLPGRNIGNLDTTDGGANMVIIKADSDSDGSGTVTNNGADLSFANGSQSILLNTEDYVSTDGTEYGTRISISDLGALASSGGADNNASNALAALQGLDSAGLVELYESNPDLYNAIYDGTEISLATLAERIIASPEEGIAAGQAAQAEAVNTILTRIAELRTGSSGIGAGDADETSIRPDSLWIRAIYSDGKQDATSSNGNNFNSYALRSKGFTIGADKDLNDYLTVGAGVSVVKSTANENNSSSSAQRSNSETNTYLGSLYAGWRDQDYFVDTSVTFGKGGTDLKGSDWEADYDSTQLGISVLAGKGFLFDNNDTLIEPRVGFNYTRLETDKYSYESADEPITIGSQNLETLELGAGVRFVTGIEVGDGLLLPEASLMAWHDFKGDDVKANVEFETGGGSFTYFGPEAEKTRYQAGVGVEYLMDSNFTVSVNYDHNWQDGFKSDTVVAKLRYDF